MLSINRTAKAISTYSADVFGVASALFELGGMTVIHDASGCNSTYTTHDEPRWFTHESMVFISALSEMEALMGDDEKLLDDIVRTAAELKPRFIAIAGTPIPMMTGFDYAAAASLLEKRSGIPAFGFNTSGMEDYAAGISMALAALAESFPRELPKSASPSCNILGLTPLDFSLNGSAQSLRNFLEKNGYSVISSWAMDTTLEQMELAGTATLNIVASSSGLAAAKVLQRRFETPYICDLPIGECGKARFLSNIARAIKGEAPQAPIYTESEADISIIGEPVLSRALAAFLHAQTGRGVQYICPLLSAEALLGAKDILADGEVEISRALQGKKFLIADPLYKPIVPKGCRFVPLPHEAFSGRMFSHENPNLIDNYQVIAKEICT